MNPSSNPGIFRRRIVLRATEGRVAAGVEDDFHHYRIVIEHDRQRVVRAEGQGLRTPYDTCQEAMPQIEALVGLPIDTGAGEQALAAKHVDPHQQCTHLFELGMLAVAQAARGGARQYDIAIPERQDQTPFEVVAGKLKPQAIDGRTRAELWRDAKKRLAWSLDGDLITAPPPFSGQNIRALNTWAAGQPFGEDDREAIRVLRRAVQVALGRAFLSPRTDFLTRVSLGACYVLQPERIARGTGIAGARLDFTNRADDLLADMAVVTAAVDE